MPHLHLLLYVSLLLITPTITQHPVSILEVPRKLPCHFPLRPASSQLSQGPLRPPAHFLCVSDFLFLFLPPSPAAITPCLPEGTWQETLPFPSHPIPLGDTVHKGIICLGTGIQLSKRQIGLGCKAGREVRK